VAGVGAAAFDLWLVRPEYVELSKRGRPVTGEVVMSTGVMGDGKSLTARQRRSYSLVAVHDTELGRQTVEISDLRKVGERIPMLCLTSARRCESADRVVAYVQRWPATPGAVLGAAGVAVALVLAIVLVLARKARPLAR
jgi:hypothetical protein